MEITNHWHVITRSTPFGMSFHLYIAAIPTKALTGKHVVNVESFVGVTVVAVGMVHLLAPRIRMLEMIQTFNSMFLH